MFRNLFFNYLIAFVLGYLVARIISGNGMIVSGYVPSCRTKLYNLCDDALRSSSGDCYVCAGHHQHQLREAGCQNEDFKVLCENILDRIKAAYNSSNTGVIISMGLNDTSATILNHNITNNFFKPRALGDRYTLGIFWDPYDIEQSNNFADCIYDYDAGTAVDRYNSSGIQDKCGSYNEKHVIIPSYDFNKLSCSLSNECISKKVNELSSKKKNNEYTPTGYNELVFLKDKLNFINTDLTQLKKPLPVGYILVIDDEREYAHYINNLVDTDTDIYNGKLNFISKLSKNGLLLIAKHSNTVHTFDFVKIIYYKTHDELVQQLCETEVITNNNDIFKNFCCQITERNGECCEKYNTPSNKLDCCMQLMNSGNRSKRCCEEYPQSC